MDKLFPKMSHFRQNCLDKTQYNDFKHCSIVPDIVPEQAFNKQMWLSIIGYSLSTGFVTQLQKVSGLVPQVLSNIRSSTGNTTPHTSIFSLLSSRSARPWPDRCWIADIVVSRLLGDPGLDSWPLQWLIRAEMDGEIKWRRYLTQSVSISDMARGLEASMLQVSPNRGTMHCYSDFTNIEFTEMMSIQ